MVQTVVEFSKKNFANGNTSLKTHKQMKVSKGNGQYIIPPYSKKRNL